MTRELPKSMCSSLTIISADEAETPADVGETGKKGLPVLVDEGGRQAHSGRRNPSERNKTSKLSEPAYEGPKNSTNLGEKSLPRYFVSLRKRDRATLGYSRIVPTNEILRRSALVEKPKGDIRNINHQETKHVALVERN